MSWNKTGLMAVLCLLCMAFIAPAVLAGEGDPLISELEGTWTVTTSRVHGDLVTGLLSKQKLVETWVITVESEDVVQITNFSGGPDYPILAKYAYGFLFIGATDDEVPYAHSGYLVIEARPGRFLRFQGEINAVGAGDFSEVNADIIKGQQISNDILLAPPPAPAAKPDAPAVKGKAPPTPPAVELLNDSYWTVKISGKGYNFTMDEQQPAKGTELWHFTATAEEGVFDVTTDDGEDEPDTIEMTYQNGFLIMADGDGNDPAEEIGVAYMQVTGKPGALKLSGKYIGYDIVSDSNDDEIESSKVTGKQIPAPPL